MKQSILVIDDEQSVREVVYHTLKAKGYDVRQAENGEIGLQIARTWLPDLIVSDIMMPRLDGYGVREQLANDPATATIPFVFLSARNEYGDFRHGMAAGADDYIAKPFAPEELFAAIEVRLKKRNTLEERHESTLRLLRKNIIYALPHELRTPLSAIIGYSEVLMMEHDKATPDEVRSWSGVINKAGLRLFRVIENYVVYAQLDMMDENEVSELTYHITGHVDNLIAEEAIRVATEAQRTDDIELDLMSIALRISADNLKKIIYELVGNAFKFSKRGSKVTVSGWREGNVYFLSIRDYGRGMTDDQISSIGAYMQFDRALHEQQGLGLGFVIARRLTEIHGGILDVQSNPGQGTLITLQFPL